MSALPRRSTGKRTHHRSITSNCPHAAAAAHPKGSRESTRRHRNGHLHDQQMFHRVCDSPSIHILTVCVCVCVCLCMLFQVISNRDNTTTSNRQRITYVVVLMLRLSREETEGTSDIYIRSNASESPEDLRVNSQQSTLTKQWEILIGRPMTRCRIHCECS